MLVMFNVTTSSYLALSVLVRLLWRTEPIDCVFVYIYKIYYQELAHAIVEADWSPDLQLPSPGAPGELMV